MTIATNTDIDRLITTTFFVIDVLDGVLGMGNSLRLEFIYVHGQFLKVRVYSYLRRYMPILIRLT